MRAVHAGPEQVAAGPFEQRRTRERVAVAAQPRVAEADDRVAAPARAAGNTPSRSTTPTAKPTRSNSPGSITPGCSDISPPSSAQPRLPAALRDPGDELVDLFGDELADRDVVEEEQRFGALRGDVVDRHRDAVDADRGAPAGEAGDRRLRADAVGGRDEQRVVVALPVDREQPAEPTDVADTRAGTSSARGP